MGWRRCDCTTALPSVELLGWRSRLQGLQRCRPLCAHAGRLAASRGVSQFRAAVAAGSPTGFWRMSGHPAVQAALRNHYFDSHGLPRLYVPAPA